MKLGSDSIQVDENTHLTLEEFRASSHAKTPLGKLFISLLDENVWSTDMLAIIHFAYNTQCIIIFSELFMKSGHGLKVEEKDGKLPTMADVTRMIDGAVTTNILGLKSSIEILKRDKENIEGKQFHVRRLIAKKAVAQKFPKVTFDEGHNFSYANIIIFNSDKKVVFVKLDDILLDTIPIYEVRNMTFHNFGNAIVSSSNEREAALSKAVLVK